jgi:hypothetical protein
MRRGFMYLTAMIDWYSRYVLSRELSNSLEGSFCQEFWRPHWPKVSRRSSTPTGVCSTQRQRLQVACSRPEC